MASRHTFRPRCEPEASRFDAFQEEAVHRPGRTFEEWDEKELQAVLKTATDLAERHGLRQATREDVELARHLACGHADFGAQWALALVRRLRPQPPASPMAGPRRV